MFNVIFGLSREKKHKKSQLATGSAQLWAQCSVALVQKQ